MSAAIPAQSPTLSADVIGDGGGVAGVIPLGDAGLDLADESAPTSAALV